MRFLSVALIFGVCRASRTGPDLGLEETETITRTGITLEVGRSLNNEDKYPVRFIITRKSEPCETCEIRVELTMENVKSLREMDNPYMFCPVTKAMEDNVQVIDEDGRIYRGNGATEENVDAIWDIIKPGDTRRLEKMLALLDNISL